MNGAMSGCDVLDRYIRVLGFFATWILVAKSAKLHKSTAEKRDTGKHLPLSVAIWDLKRTNRTPWPKVVV